MSNEHVHPVFADALAAAAPAQGEPSMNNPVMDQSELLGVHAMGHAGRPLRPHVPNSGFDSRDGGHIATPSSITALDGNYADFLLALKRPRPLGIENSNAALRGRIDEIDHHIAAFKAWLTALVEDTARNVALAQRPDDIVESHMTDLAGDLRGHFIQAIERNAA